MIPQKLMNVIADGEGDTVEFKESPSNIGSIVSAFANTRGGCVVVGIRDDGTIKGISRKELEAIGSFLQNVSPMPAVKIEKLKIDDRTIAVVEVAASKTLVFYGNTAYIRIGAGNRPLNIEEILDAYIEKLRVNFDSLSSPSPSSQASRSVASWFFKKREETRDIRKRGKIVEKFKALDIVKGKKLTYGGLLFFTEDPQKILDYAAVRVVEITEDLETISEKHIGGPVWKQADEAYKEVVGRLKRIDIRGSVGRRKIAEYPEGAVREAIVNALVHRNYSIPADIRILMFPSRTEIISPGGFPPGVEPGVPQHVPRNRLLAKYMYDIGYIERYGFGIVKMKKLCEDHPSCRLDIIKGPDATVKLIRDVKEGIDETDRRIISLLTGRWMQSLEISKKIGLTKPAVLHRIKRLMNIGIVKISGRGPRTKYAAYR